MPKPKRCAVFLSYATEDVDVARRICGALQTVGVEVCFDDGEPRSGDARDAKIKAQIRDCTLFLALISGNTNAQREGAFRLEWQLAEHRAQEQANGAPFILPVVVDFTNEQGALVPVAFRTPQWIRILGRDIPMAFAVRVQELAAGGAEKVAESSRAAQRETGGPSARRAWLGWGIGAVVAIFVTVFWFSRK